MAYAFVQAAHDYGVGLQPRGLLIHMAEGGGTVGYLARDPARGVSVHFVIERSGRVVQMLRLDHISGSTNPTAIRTTNDPDGFYGVTAAKGVLGDGWSDPNRHVISVEIEGFAAEGPNADQQAALIAWAADMWASVPGLRGNLGHRDLTDWKACPGKLIPWERIGGHGVADKEEEPMIVGGGLTRTSSHVKALKAGQTLHKQPAGAVLTKLSKDASVEYYGIAAGWHAVEVVTKAGFDDGIARPVICYVPATAGPVTAKPPAPPPDCSAAVETFRKAAAAAASLAAGRAAEAAVLATK